VAETDRKASGELRKKSVKTKQDRSALVNRFGPGGNLQTGLDQYNRWVLQELDKETGESRVVYLLVDPNNRDWEVVNGTEVIKRVKAAYGNQDALRKVLYDKGYISESDYVSKSVPGLNGGIIRAATEFSTEVADSFTTEGKMKFPTFETWITGRATSAEGEGGGPRRDIQKYDRDVVRQMVVDAYLDSPNANLPDEAIIERDTDKYMKMIEKGTLTKGKKNKAGEFETVSTPGFSEQRLRDEITKNRAKEFAGDEKTRTDLDFLAFLAQLEG
jgi:hypothetical protein